MKIEYQKYLAIIKIGDMICYIYIVRSMTDLWKLWRKYSNDIYEVQSIPITPNLATKKDRTIYEVYNYHEDKNI